MAFTDKEFTYGDVTFRVDKLLPQEAKAVFMAHVRPLLEGALAAESGGGGDGLAMILGIVAKAPQTHYDAVMRALYQHINVHLAGSGAAATVGRRRRTGVCWVWIWLTFCCWTHGRLP